MIFANITTAVFYIRKLIKIVIYTFFHLQVLGLSGLHHLFSLQWLCYGAFVISLSRLRRNVGVFFLPNEKPAFRNNAGEADQTALKELPCCLPERQRIVSYSDVSPSLPHPSRVSLVSSDHCELEVGGRLPAREWFLLGRAKLGDLLLSHTCLGLAQQHTPRLTGTKFQHANQCSAFIPHS